jgi:diguanylate cyclase (GGDEF)-like protein/PAS domain S-box-containing protein
MRPDTSADQSTRGHRFAPGERAIDMSSALNSTEQLQAEVKELRRQLREADEKSQRAEAELKATEQRHRLLGDSAPFGIFVIDTAGRITGFNRKMAEMLRWPLQRELPSINITDLQKFIEAGITEDYRRCIEKKRLVTKAYPCVTAGDSDDDCLHLRFSLCPVLDDDGSVSEVLTFVEDISDLKLAEMTIRESEDRYRLLFQSTPIALIERDASRLKAYLEELRQSGIHDFSAYLQENPEEAIHCVGMIRTVDFNDAFMDLIEAKDRDELTRGPMPVHPSEVSRFAREVILMIAEGNLAQEREETLLTLRGNKKSVLAKSLIVTGHEDTFARIVISLVDISKRKQAEEALRASEKNFRELAMRDTLTGLYNRRYLYRSLEDLIKTSTTTRSRLSLIFMDLDYFKRVVDTHGHLNGSQAIREVAATIKESIEEPAYAVAYAGDEFVVVLPGHDKDQAVAKALTIQSRINDTVYLRSQGLAVKLQASFGVATFPDHAIDLTGLLATADRALFGVKANGKSAIGWADMLV